jgi:UDP-GlcNAc:undecaprenyl-phosphate GlcNAc-1-phosphate transferase
VRLDILLGGGGAFVLSAFLSFSLRKWSLRRGILLSKSIPCVGGLAFGAVFLASAALYFLRRGEGNLFWGQIFFLALAMLLFGLWDDLKNLSIRSKFGFQMLVAVLLISLGVKTQIVLLSGPQNFLLTMVWLLWIFNAFNLLDVLDGLAAGSALIASVCFFMVWGPEAHAGIALPALLAATLAGFLFFNFPPAKIYMGNAGSYFLGFVFGAVSLIISYASPDRIVALATPAIVLGFLIFDTVFLVAARIWRKRKPFYKSGDHLCLRYLALGYSKRKVLFLLWGLCCFYAASGILINHADNRWGLGILVVVFLISAWIARRAVAVKVLD